MYIDFIYCEEQSNVKEILLSSSWSHPNISSAMDLLLFYWRMKRTKCNYICQLGYSGQRVSYSLSKIHTL